MTTDDAALPTGKSHVSPSEVMQWAQCSWRHKRAQVDRVNRFTPNPVPTFGVAIHEAQESFLKTGKMDASLAHAAIDKLWDRCGFREPKATLPDGFEGPVSDDFQAFIYKHNTTVETAREQFGFTKKSRMAAHRDADMILADVPEFMTTTFPNWQFIAAEMYLYEPIADTGVNLKGFIDGVIAATGKRGEGLVWIIDWKTSAWGWKREKKQDPLVQNQLVLYKRYWIQKVVDIQLRSRDVRCGFVILKRSAKPGEHCELVPISVGDVTIKRAERRVLNMISSLRRGTAIKDRTACLYCDYNTECVGTWADHMGRLHHVPADRDER